MLINEILSQGIPRNKMPQIHAKDIAGDYDYKQGMLSLDKMIPVQKERIGSEYDKAVEKIQAGEVKPILVDKDFRIVNGHHRFDAYRDLGHKKVAAVKVDATLEELMHKYAHTVKENFADGKVKGKSRPGRVKKAGASCKGSVSSLRAKAKKYSGEKGKMYHWCANMKAGKKK